MIDVVSVLRDVRELWHAPARGGGRGRKGRIDFTSVKHVIAKIRMPRHVARLVGRRAGAWSVKVQTSAASGRSLHRA